MSTRIIKRSRKGQIKKWQRKGAVDIQCSLNSYPLGVRYYTVSFVTHTGTDTQAPTGTHTDTRTQTRAYSTVMESRQLEPFFLA